MNNTKTLYKERKLLKRINKEFSESDERYISLQKLNISSNDYYLQLLDKKNLIIPISNAVTFSDPLDHRIKKLGIAPTTECLHFFEWRKEELNSFLLKNVYITIGVSISTTCLIWFAKWLIELATH